MHHLDTEFLKAEGKRLGEKGDAKAVSKLVAKLTEPHSPERHEALYLLEEIARADADLLAPHAKTLSLLLLEKHTHSVWGAMNIFRFIAAKNPELVAPYLNEIVAATDRSVSVITRDMVVALLSLTGSLKQHREDNLTLILEILSTAPTNQVGQYAEAALPLVKTTAEKHRPGKY